MGTRKSMVMGMLAVLLTAFSPMIMAQEFKAVTIGNYDNVTVIEFTGNYDTPILNNPANEFPRQVIAKEFYRTHKDDYDFLVIFSNFDFQMPILDIAGTQYMAAGFYLPVRNNTRGIGDDIFDNSFQFGSNGKLQGTVDMGYVGKKVTEPLDTGFEQTMTTLSHELLHRWSAYVKFKKWDGSISKDLLGSADAHWSFLLDTQGSMQYGNRWINNGNGTFTSLSGSKYYSSLDLYLMGLIPKDQVPPVFLIENPDINKKRLPEPGVTISGTPHTVSIDDIIAAEGERTPNTALSQKNFKIGCIYITRPSTFESRDEIYPLRNVLKNWAIWFSSLTKGKAMVRIDVRPEETVPVNPDITPPPYDERTAPPSISEALAWLLNAQEQNGSWRDSFQTLERETAETIFTLGHFPETQANVSAGIDWLSGTTDLNTDYLSRKIEIFIRVNLDTTALLGQLLAKQNADGGWGSAGIYSSNAADTAMALRALWAADIQTENVVRPAIDFLKNEQHADGGWSQDNQEGTIQATANVLKVLTHYQEKYPLSEAIQKGLAWLFGKQNPDGGFGNSPSTVYDTALALNLLKSFAVPPDMTDQALNYILSFQSENGSWYASPYQTAQALNALYLWYDRVAPDLSVTADNFTFTPQTVTNPPEKIIIRAKVENLGLLEASQVKVALYDGIVVEANKKGEVVISLTAKSSMNVEFEATIDDAFAHTFIVVADPDNQIQEVNENNNQASKDLANQTCLKPDLVVGSEGMIIGPESINTNPQALVIQAVVQNISRVEAKDVKVALYDGEITPAAKVGEQNVTIAAGSSTLVLFNVTVSDAKSRVFYVFADPDNLLEECLETNNRAAKRISTKTTYDLEAVQLSVSSPSMVMMDMLTITSRIANKGTSDGFNVPVRYFLNTPSGPHEIGLYYLNIPTGKTVAHTTNWQADLVGENMALTVQVDPSDVFKELLEDNNTAAALITVKQYTQPNLAVRYQDITISPTSALEGGSAIISASISNNGFSIAENIGVDFYEGLSDSDKKLIGTQTIPALAPSQSATVTMNWGPILNSGKRYITVKVDPQKQIEEFDETDNSAFIELDILSLPDLAIATNSISFNPEAPKEGEEVTIQVSVQNLGQQEALNVPVQVKEGTEVTGVGTISRIAGLSAGNTSFQYTTQGKPGGHRIDVTVDPQNLILEKSKENNTASRSFGVQNADLWLSEPYISPNGDGIKDNTQFFFRLKEAQTVQVKVVNSKGKIVKSITGDEFKNTSGNSVTWDGLDEQGRVVLDGQYQFQVHSAGATVLVMLPVIVDTDRSSLTEAIGTKYLFQNNLTCALPNIDWWQWFPDESGIVFLINSANANTPGYNKGIYTVSPDGEDIKRIVPAEWCGNNGTKYSYYYNDVAVSPDGQRIVFNLGTYNKETQIHEKSELWITDRYGENRVLLAAQACSETWPPSFFSSPGFSPNGRYVAYYGSNKIGLIKIDGDLDRIEHDIDYVEGYRWSPDSSRIWYFDDNLLEFDLNGHSREIFTTEEYEKSFEVLSRDKLVVYLRWENQIWLVDASGNGQHRLLVSGTNIEEILSFAANQQNGTITYMLGRTGDSCLQTTKIGLCDDQGACKTLYQNDLSKFWSCDQNLLQPVWAPNGQRLTFVDRAYEKLDDSDYNGYVVILAQPDFTKKAFQVSKHEYPGVIPWGGLNEAKPDIYYGSLQWFQDNENLLAEDGGGIFAIAMEEGKKTYFPVTRKNIVYLDPRLSSHGRYMVHKQGVDENSICYDKGNTDFWVIGSLLNLTADLKVIKNKNSITLKGTAADLHFESYSLQYADINKPTDWKPIMPPVGHMVVNNTFLEWVPPNEGIFLVRLIVQDKAGNTAGDRKRVSWGQFTSINDLKQSEKIFSPNGDKIKDTVEISYQVAAPVHLQFFIYDEVDRLVRTIEKNYDEPQPGFMSWDGQNDQGMVVQDGRYKIKVLDYDFEVEVDTLAPTTALQLDEETVVVSFDSQVGSVDMRFSLEGLAWDKNLKEWTVEYGQGENPQEWYSLGTGIDPLMKQNAAGEPLLKEIESFRDDLFDFPINKRFRITATDSAGNRVAFSNDLIDWEQEIFITQWDSKTIQYAMDVKTIKVFEGQDLTGLIKPGIHTIRGIENIRQSSQELNLQFYRNNAWENAAAITVNAASGHPELVWDNSSIPVSELEKIWMVRLRALDLNGKEYFSPALLIGESRFALEGSNACGTLSLKGEINLAEDLKRLRVQIRSYDDPVYKQWTDFWDKDINQGHSIPSGQFEISDLPDLQSSRRYLFKMLGLGMSNKEYYSEEISSQLFKQAVCFSLKVQYLKAACNLFSGNAKIEPKIQTGSEQIEVDKISYYLQEGGTWKLLAQFPGAQDLLLDTSGWLENIYPVKAALDYQVYDSDSQKMIAGQREATAYVFVNRVMPTAEIIYPENGVSVCPKFNKQDSLTWYILNVEGLADDDQEGNRYALYYKIGEKPIWYAAETCRPVLENGLWRLKCSPINGETLHGITDSWNVTNLIGVSDLWLKLESVDKTGNTSCRVILAKIGIPPGIKAKSEPALFSPNQDGVLDETSVTFSLEQDSKLSLQIFKTGASEPAKSFFISELKPAGTYSIAWDGTDDNGQRVADGKYEIRAGIPNICDDSLVEAVALIEIDNTPPQIDITYPKPDSRPGLVVEVKGTVDDPHFDYYQLIVPELNILIGSGDKAKINNVLGRWNRYGLNGRYTLKFNAEDTLGNKREKIVDVQLDAVPDFIKSLGAEPEIFSPNNDGKLETLTVAYDLSAVFPEGFNITLQVLQGQTIVRTYSPVGVFFGGFYQWSWDGKNDANVSMPDGVYSLLLIAKLASDNNLEQKEAVTFELDRTTPVIELQAPQEGAFLKDPNIDFKGSVADKNLTHYELNLQGDGKTWLLDKGQQSRIDYSFARLENPPDSPYTLSVKAEDAALIVFEQKINFTVDRTPPKIMLAAPSENELFGNQKQVIGVKAQIEEKNPLQWVLRYGRGEKPDTWMDLISGTTLPAALDPYNWSVSAQSGVTDGLYIIMLYAKDKAGWEADAKVKAVVDNTPPIATITVPAENGYVTKTMDIKGTAFDDNLAEYTLEISEGDCAQAYKWTLLKKDTKSVQVGTLVLFSALPQDGRYCLRLKVVDKVGYESEAKTTIIIDTAQPAAPVLSGKVQDKANALLTWTVNAEADLAGYDLYRDNKKINTILIKETQYRDQDLKEGSYNYIVKAVDKAGLESDPSNTISLKIDLTPPTAHIAIPNSGAKVNDVVAVKGTAYSEEDFKEYRLYAGQGTGPAAWNLLVRSPVPVPYGKLSDWDTIALPEGSYIIKLEAVDLSGNTNMHQILVTVDNMPPGPPNLTKAEQQSPLIPNVDLAWDAKPEPDVIGYLVYRNHELANVSVNVIGDLKPYLIKGTTYVDTGLPDGKFIYYIMAMDEAGNISEQSNTRDVNIDTHAPRVIITMPNDGQRFETTILIKGETPDLDIAQVQFQYQKPGESTWNNLNSSIVNLPYITYLDSQALNLTYGNYRLRAQATDLGGRTDEDPPTITVYYTDTTAPAGPINLKARADEGQVILSWNSNFEQDLKGYNVYLVQNSQKTKLNPETVSGTTTYLHDGSGLNALADAEYIYEITALDIYGNESNASNQDKTLIYTPLLEQLYTPSGVSSVVIRGRNVKPSDFVDIYLSGTSQMVSIPITRLKADEQGGFGFNATLQLGENWFWAKASDAFGNKSKQSEPMVVVYNEPPAIPIGLQGTAQDHTVHLTWNANTEADLAGYFLYQDGQRINQLSSITTGTASASYGNNSAKYAFDQNLYTSWCCYLADTASQWWQLELPSPVLIEKIALSWRESNYAPRDFDIQTWTGQIWLTLRQVRDNQEISNSFEFKPAFRTQKVRLLIKRTAQNSSYACLYEVNLFKSNPIDVLPQPAFNDPDRPRGEYHYQVSAVDIYGLESSLSAEVLVPVDDMTPPAAPINLTAVPDKADMNLTWTANNEPDLAGYHVYRKNFQGWTRVNPALVTSNTYKDASLANGTYTYRVTAIDQATNESEPSNEASATIDIELPQQPINLQITAIPAGQALKVCWEYNGSPASGFNLYRALQPGGPYVRVNMELIKETCYLDEGLVNGVKYYYYVTAMDNFGNEGGSSLEQYAVPKDTVAPEPPVIFYPILSSIPFEVEKADQTLIGFAEPDSLVELFKDGDSIAKTMALKSAAQQTYSFSENIYRMAVSPNSRAIAFITNDNNLFLKDLDTNEIIMSDSIVLYVRWLHDKKRLSFTAQDENRRYRIFIYDVSTGEKTRLTDDNDYGWEYSPSWCRDGKYAAFISYHEDTEKVRIKNMVTGEMKSIINSNGASCPEISPDGSKVVYFKENILYLADVITGASQVMNSAASWPNEYGTYGWSPEGKRLAYISYQSSVNELYIRDMQSGVVEQTTRLQDAGLSLLGFRWSPDGKALLCLTQKGNEYTLWIMAVEAPQMPKILKQWSSGYLQAMDWVYAGQVVYNHYDGNKNEIGFIQLPGTFFFDVLLNPGYNDFTVAAKDAAGNRSEPSDSVTLILPEQVLPDLEITTDTIFVYPAAPIIGDQIKVYAVVENKGMAEAKGFNTDIYLKDSQDQWVQLKQEYIDRIAAGSSVAIPLTLEATAYPGGNTLVVFVDAESRVYELSENNNFAQRDFYVATQEGIIMTTTLDAQEYQAESDLSIHIAVNNSGPARNLNLAVQIEDENGVAVHVFDLEALNLAYGTGKDIDLQWNTGLTYAGHYQLRAILKEEEKVILENLTPFKIVPEISASAELSTNKLHYGAMEDVFLNTLLMNQGRNFDIPHLDVRTSILHESVQVFNNTFGLDNLPVASSVNLSGVWNTGLSAAGTYQARVEFLLEGQVIANSVADFFIDPEVKLSGELKAVPILVYFNRPVKADLIIHNKGNTSLDELAVKVLILDPDTQSVLGHQEKTVTMDSNGNGSGQCEFSTIGLSLKAYKLILQIQYLANTQTLATAVFSIKDGVPPNVAVLAPENNSSQQQPFAILVQVADDASSVNRVEYRLDQETQWRLLPPVDPTTSQYGTRWVPKEAEEGPHTIWFRAFDRAGNVSEPIATSIRIVARVDMTISLNAEEYGMNEDAAIKVNLANIAWAKSMTLKVNILNNDGVVLHSFDPIQTALAMDESREFAFTWNTGLNPAGPYKAQAVLTKAELNLGEKTAAFNILPVLKFSSALNTDKTHYGLKENVALNLSVTNNGNAAAPLLNLKLKIRPEGGQDLFIKDFSVADLGPGITTHLAETWNTAQFPAGNYQARLEVYLNDELASSSETGFTIDPVLTITGTLAISPVQITPGENYQANYAVRNEGNVVAQNTPVKVLVNDPDQAKIAEQQEPMTLGINESKTGSFAFGSQGYKIGMYQAVLQAAWDSVDHDLDRKAFEIIDSAPPFEKLTGTIQATPNPVYLGQEESFQYTLRNEAGQALQGLTVKILVIDPATQEIKITLSEQIDLAEKSVHTATLKAAINGLALKVYQTVLMVEMSGKVPRQLAETTFEVVAAQELEADKTLVDKTRLLIWVNDNCPSSCRPKEHGFLKDGNADLYSEASCTTGLQKEISVSEPLQSPDKVYCDPNPCKECLDLTLLEIILDQVADHYKIVFNPCSFADELRNPLYTDILILGDSQPLPDHIAAELRERIHCGIGLISSQWLKHGCSADYDEVFGITYKGVLSGSDPLIEIIPSPVTTPRTFKATGKSYNIQTDPDTLIAGWIKTDSKWQLWETGDTIMCPVPQGPYAAMVLHDYGQGRGIYQAFDLGRSLNEANKEWVQTLLDNSLKYVHKARSGNVFLPYELAPIRMALKNMGAVLIARVQESFPKELSLYDPIAKQWIDESPWVFDTGLDANGKKDIPFYYLTPDKTGTFKTQTDINILLNGELIPVKQLILDLAVIKDLDLILDETINILKALSLPPHDQARVKNALAVLAKVKTKIVRTRSDVDDIIKELLKAVDYLRSVKSGDMSLYRLELDRLMRSYAGLYYLFVPAGEYLQGGVEALPNPVKTNQEVNFHVKVFNDGNEAFRDLKLKVKIMDPNSGQVIKILEKALILEGNSSQELDLKTVLKYFKAKTYKAQLKAYSGLLPEPKMLAEGDLTVTAQ